MLILSQKKELVQAHQQLLFLFYQSRLYSLMLWLWYLLCLHQHPLLKVWQGLQSHPSVPLGLLLKGGTGKVEEPPVHPQHPWLAVHSHRAGSKCILQGLWGVGRLEYLLGAAVIVPAAPLKYLWCMKWNHLKSGKALTCARCTSAGLGSNPEHLIYS